MREAPTSKVRPDAEQFIAELGPAVAAAEARERQGKIAAAKGAEALQLAQTMFAGGQLGDAAGVLDRLLREPGNGRELLAEGYLLRGRVAAGQGDPLAAEGSSGGRWSCGRRAEIAEPKGQEAAALEAARKTDGGGRAAAGAVAARRGDGEPAGAHRRQGRGRQREDGGDAGARLPRRGHGRVPDRAGGAARDAVRAGADAGAGRAHRLLRARAGRARRRGGRERHADPALPAAGRGADRGAPRAAALVPEVVVLDAGRRGRGRRGRDHLRRDAARRTSWSSRGRRRTDDGAPSSHRLRSGLRGRGAGGVLERRARCRRERRSRRVRRRRR